MAGGFANCRETVSHRMELGWGRSGAAAPRQLHVWRADVYERPGTRMLAERVMSQLPGSHQIAHQQLVEVG